MNNCIFVWVTDHWYCTKCGFCYRPRVSSDKTPGSRNCPATHGRPVVPGDWLHWLIRRLVGESPDGACHCAEHTHQMNAWGVWGCLRRLGTITGWMTEEAARRELRIARRPRACRLSAAALVLAALALALIGRMDVRRLPRDL